MEPVADSAICQFRSGKTSTRVPARLGFSALAFHLPLAEEVFQVDGEFGGHDFSPKGISHPTSHRAFLT